MEVEPMEESYPTTTIRKSMLSCPGITSIKETNSTDKYGKWLIVTNKARRHQAFHYVDETLLEVFQNLRTLDLDQYRFEHFPTPCRGNKALMTDDDVIACMDRLGTGTKDLYVTMQDSKSPPRKVQHRIEVTFDNLPSNKNPPKQTDNAWNKGSPNNQSASLNSVTHGSLTKNDISAVVRAEVAQQHENTPSKDYIKEQINMAFAESRKEFNEMQKKMEDLLKTRAEETIPGGKEK